MSAGGSEWRKDECPSGQVMVGACGSGRDADCTDECDADAHHAIKCADAVSSYSVGDGAWSEAQSYGDVYKCPDGQVACGACQSGANADCDNGAAFMQLKCCSVAV